MRKLVLLSSVVALCVVTTTGILAQQTDPMPKDADRNSMNLNSKTDTNANTTVTGKIVSTSGSTFVMETDAGNRMTFDTTAIKLPAGASVGTRVQVAYAANPMGNGNRLSMVTVMPATETVNADAKYRATGSVGTVRAPDATGSVPADTTDSGMYASNRKLPKTAGRMPLIGLVGIFALGAGIAIRILRRGV